MTRLHGLVAAVRAALRLGDDVVVCHSVDEPVAHRAWQVLIRGGIPADVRWTVLPAPDSGIPVLRVYEVLVSAGNERSAREALDAEGSRRDGPSDGSPPRPRGSASPS